MIFYFAEPITNHQSLITNMRIAFIADALDFQYAGIHIYTREILKALVAVDTENEYIVVRGKSGKKIEGTEEIIVPVNPNIPIHKQLRIFTDIPRALVKVGADVVVEPRHLGPFNLPKQIHRVTVLHDLTPILFPDYHVLSSRILHRHLLPHVLRRTDHIITVSEHTRRDIVARFPFVEKKSTAILLGRDESFVPKNEVSVLEKYGIRQPYFLYVGTLEPRKNLGVLVAAYNAFRKKSGLNYQLVLVGKKGWKINDLLKKIRQSPFQKDIILTGYVAREELPVLYTMSEIFVYPSLYEGFGLPVLEAMSCGACVITSEVSSLPEVGGGAAVYFDPNLAEQLADLMLKLTSNQPLLNVLSEKSLTQAQLFCWEKTARETLAVLTALAVT